MPDLDHYKFKDYQSGGVDDLAQVKASFLRFAIFLNSKETPKLLEMTLDDASYRTSGDTGHAVQVHVSLDHAGGCSAVFETFGSTFDSTLRSIISPAATMVEVPFATPEEYFNPVHNCDTCFG